MDGFRVHFDINPIGLLNEFNVGSEGKKSFDLNFWEQMRTPIKGKEFSIYPAGGVYGLTA